MAPRGPRSDLCVVVVTTSAYSKGDGITPAATNPLMCAMSANRIAFCFVCHKPVKKCESQRSEISRHSRNLLRIGLHHEKEENHIKINTCWKLLIRHDRL